MIGADPLPANAKMATIIGIEDQGAGIAYHGHRPGWRKAANSVV